MAKKKHLTNFLVIIYALLLITGCGKGETSMSDSTANEVFQNYYAVLTGTMSASEHHDDYQWKNHTEPFPYLDEAKWTDFSAYFRSCDTKGEARIYGKFDTYDLNLGYDDSRVATDKVAAYWESKGWEVKDISSEKDSDMRQILTTTDTNVDLLYTASSRGESIEATSKCIPEFYDEDNPAETPQVFKAEQP